MKFLTALALFLPLQAAPWKAEEEMLKALDQGKIPAMACITFNETKTLNSAVVGTTRSDKKFKPAKDAAWHIGSDGKAMTATLMARLVEKKLVTWDTTVAEIFPKEAKDFHPDAAKITITQLLSHTAGLPANPQPLDRLKSRLAVTKIALKEKPAEGFLYSNWGYIIAGAVVEKLTKSTWEKAIENELFTPLGIKSFGFGAPTGNRAIRGHLNGQPTPTGFAGDNPPLYGPAGGLHLSLADWVLFARDHLKGHQGQSKLLSKESYLKLHTPIANNYALGWLTRTKNGQTTALGHDGSNTMWYARVSLDLEKNTGLCIVANTAGPDITRWIGKVEEAAK
ncbi:serine hydrolase domain-containing protein [Verrucomicrobiaceae bacterium 227]